MEAIIGFVRNTPWLSTVEPFLLSADVPAGGRPQVTALDADPGVKLSTAMDFHEMATQLMRFSVAQLSHLQNGLNISSFPL